MDTQRPVSRSVRYAQKKAREDLARKEAAEAKKKKRSKKTSTKKEKQDVDEKETSKEGS